MYYKKYHRQKHKLTDEERKQIEEIKKRIYTNNTKIKEKARMVRNKIVRT